MQSEAWRRWRRETARMLAAGFLMAALSGGDKMAARVEIALAPVIRDLGATEIHRDQFLACWRWNYIKARRATQTDVNIDIRVDGRRIDAAPLVWGDDGLRYFMSDLTSGPSPAPHSRVVCVDLVRARVHPDEAMRVVFSATYVSSPGLWQSRYTMRDVAVPAFQRP